MNCRAIQHHIAVRFLCNSLLLLHLMGEQAEVSDQSLLLQPNDGIDF